MSRLFSNLELNGARLNRKPGSVLGCTALVAGTTVGAGILALPAVTLPSGLLPSTMTLIVVWLYMVASGLLLTEVNVHTTRQLGRPGLGLLATTRHTLGSFGAHTAGILYLFIHYALLVAYMSRGGDILAVAIAQAGLLQAVPPAWLGVGIFAVLFGGLLYFGSDRLVGTLNSAFVAIVIVSFTGLLALTLADINPSQLLTQNWQAVSVAIPVMFVALVYQNVVPVITHQLEGDVKKIRQSILVGSAIPLIMFLAWNAAILGCVNLELAQAASNDIIFDPLEALRSSADKPWLGALISVFSEFAVVTSFIGFVYGLLNFWGDAFEIQPDDNVQRLPLYGLVLLPPLGLSVLNPSIFLEALDYAGAFGMSVLFGIIPATMAWKQRYQNQNLSTMSASPLVPGGKMTLIAMIGVSIGVITEHVV
ncbi:MAG: tyrosine transporter [Cyanothece sp. SIO1E1]|nr:tyrosine transporter [Cyanothece sp. SIO1E1]